MKLTFWQNSPSIHQSALIRALSALPHTDVTVVTASDVTQHRRAMGWGDPDFGDALWLHRPEPSIANELLDGSGPTDTHIFSGLGAYPWVHVAFRRALRTRSMIGVMAEAADGRGWRGAVRRLSYRLRHAAYGRHIDFVLATGQRGIDWFAAAGFASARIFPFAYFVEAPDAHFGQGVNGADHVRLVYVGQLYLGKGVDLLLGALTQLSSRSWELHVIGDGPSRDELSSSIADPALRSRVTWHGYLPQGEVRSIVGRSDLLILPSRYDGWGAVINEALASGTPVIASDACGAADLVVSELQGVVVRSNDIKSLLRALDACIQRGPVACRRRSDLRQWAAGHISGEAGARYLARVIDHLATAGPRPIPPWHLPQPRSSRDQPL